MSYRVMCVDYLCQVHGWFYLNFDTKVVHRVRPARKLSELEFDVDVICTIGWHKTQRSRHTKSSRATPEVTDNPDMTRALPSPRHLTSLVPSYSHNSIPFIRPCTNHRRTKSSAFLHLRTRNKAPSTSLALIGGSSTAGKKCSLACTLLPLELILACADASRYKPRRIFKYPPTDRDPAFKSRGRAFLKFRKRQRQFASWFSQNVFDCTLSKHRDATKYSSSAQDKSSKRLSVGTSRSPKGNRLHGMFHCLQST